MKEPYNNSDISKLKINCKSKYTLQLMAERDKKHANYIWRTICEYYTCLNKLDDLKDIKFRCWCIRLVTQKTTHSLTETKLPKDVKEHLICLIKTIGKNRTYELDPLFSIVDRSNNKLVAHWYRNKEAALKKKKKLGENYRVVTMNQYKNLKNAH